jgi:hypothetical protein
MKKLSLVLILFYFLAACNHDRLPLSKSFENVDGLLYFELPETGSTISAVFFPVNTKKADINLSDLDTVNFKIGMKFNISNRRIQDKLYKSDRHEAILKGDIDRTIFLVGKTRIYYHINKPVFSETNSMIRELRSDTLLYLNKPIVLKYYFNRIEIDSIKIN